MRHFYDSIAVPKMLYATDLFLVPETGRSKGMKGFIARLAKIQRQASLNITGALRSDPTGAIDACVDILPFPLLIERIVFQATSWLVTLPQLQPLGMLIITDHLHMKCYML